MTTSHPAQWEEQWFLLRKYYKSQADNLERYLGEKETKEKKGGRISTDDSFRAGIKRASTLENEKLAKLKDTRENAAENCLR